MKKTLCLSLFAFTSLFADADLERLNEQVQQLQMQVETLNTKSAQAVNTSASFSQNAYLPEIALILNMSAVSRDVSNNDYANFALPGFIPASTAPLPFNKDKGFNFNYAEVAMHSVVDPYFEAFTIFHLQPNEFEIGEAYVQTTALPYGLRIRAGKFKSHFGRINSKHQHSWNFDSQPIIYEALFGPDAISDAGVQLQWVAPTDTYIMAGVEAMQGSNDRSFGDTDNGNSLYVGYVKSSVDVGEDLSILAGVSLAHGKNVDALDGSSNPTNIYGVDLTLRDQLGSYSALIWQSEYLYRNKDLGTRKDKQAGLYGELVYQYNNNYSAGFRYDAITQNDTDLTAYAGIDTDNLDRYTAMLEYKPFPMSRLRLSYTYDRTKIMAGERKDMNEVMLSLNIATGAHGAHNY
ncbi:hypothetical protein [Sulfurimonas sp.]|uniref:hypothetical protein n=1 Tax=Sulfurimonas sp. TaxID=2022749 RepID=UPI002620A4AC|nr:hypothetical protein [Sulfurimonas sp.]